MKLLHLSPHDPAEFRGGTEAHVETLAGAQRDRGDTVSVLCGSERRDVEGRIEVDVRDGVRWLRLLRRPHENYAMDFRLPRVAEEVVRLADEERPDLVHLHHWLNLSGDLASRLTAAGHAVVATLHDFTLVCARFFLVRPDGESCAEAFPLPALPRCVDCTLPDAGLAREALEGETRARQLLSRTEAGVLRLAFAPSIAVAERWQRSGLFADGRLLLLRHGVPQAAEPPAPARPRDGRLRLATWGHLAPAKGVLDLLAALRLLADPRVELVILGEPVSAEHGAELRAAAAGLPVEFRGGRYGAAELRALQADLAVFPSRAEETFGLVVAEARALGLPVVVSDRGALPEWVGGAGAVVPAARPAALAVLLEELLEDPLALERWRRQPCPLLATPAAHAAELAALYARALQTP